MTSDKNFREQHMSTRREFIKQVSVVAGLGAAASIGFGLAPLHVQAATAGNWRMPDEGDKHRRAIAAGGAVSTV
jgi:agmatine deiminase